MAFHTIAGNRLAQGFTLLALCSLFAAPGLARDDQLHQLRADRRQASLQRNIAVDKAAGPAKFGLLVIPVDFSDARLSSDWDQRELSQRLEPDTGETLSEYFRVASGGRLELSIITAPVVHLPETRRLYSDRDLNGFTRTRKLATESITAVRDLGLEFRRLDIDGPDGIAGTADDDGQVDGVLILHAGIGNENDPDEGLIQALQFYLDEPVMSLGISASFYAVASLQSGPGIWAHETAHLLGMEDRYDPLLHPAGASEVLSVGGLGRFSLMSSGAWGIGGGYGAALPDAYSSAQMGWIETRNLAGAVLDTLQPGESARVWTTGTEGPEFFLLETRDPVGNAPFDANVPGGQLLVYHIDENVAEGNWHEDGPYQWHLRARLVEADADRMLAQGLDPGRPEDLFPGPLQVLDFGPNTIPASNSYESGPSGIALTNIAGLPGGVSFGVSLDTEHSLSFDYSFIDPGSGPLRLDFRAQETGQPASGLRCEVRSMSVPSHGFFVADGSQIADFALVESEPGLWMPTADILWQLDANLGDDSTTSFRFRIYNGTDVNQAETRRWAWTNTGNVLDFRWSWPWAWTIAYPDNETDTTWHRWDAAPWLTADQDMVLACTGVTYTDASAWPNVNYENSAYTTLTSEPLGADIGAVRLTHAIEVEMLTDRVAMDGGLVVWVGPDGAEVTAVPLEGYGGSVEEKSFSPLHGQDAFVNPALNLEGDVPEWRTDTFPIPANGPGPWRLRLVFGANSLWRARGWFIADIEPVLASETPVGFVAEWNGDLSWSWPWSAAGDPVFRVETRSDGGSAWSTVLEESLEPVGAQRYGVPGSTILAALSGAARQRHQIRIVGPRPAGRVASQQIVVYPDGGDGVTAVMGEPWPNPANGEVRFLLDIPTDSKGLLRIYDVRGRLILTRHFDAGQQLVVWDGRSENGARAATGIYYIRLEGSGPVLTRKVVLIH